MRTKLSLYSVVLLVGLAVTSGLLLAANPFNGAPAAAAAGSATPPSPGANAASAGPQGSGAFPSGGSATFGHHDDDGHSEWGGSGNSTATPSPSGPVQYYDN